MLRCQQNYSIVFSWSDMVIVLNLLSLVTRKPDFGVCDQVRLKPACSASETIYSLEILEIVSIGIKLSTRRTTKVLIRLRGCAGRSAPSLFAYAINRFSHDMALLIVTVVQLGGL